MSVFKLVCNRYRNDFLRKSTLLCCAHHLQSSIGGVSIVCEAATAGAERMVITRVTSQETDVASKL